MHRALRLSLPWILLAGIALVGCSPKTPVRTDPTRPVSPPDRGPRVPYTQIRREPDLRILLVRNVSAVEIRGSRGFVVLDEAGRRLAGYGAGQRIHLFQRPEAPDRLDVHSELRRGGKMSRAARRRLPFRGPVLLQPQRGGTLTLNGNSYRGRIRLQPRRDHFDCVNLVPMEQYLRGVVPHEIGHLKRKGFEAMRAQAVVSRNYAVQRLADSRDKPWDMVATVYDQVYRGAREEWHLANRAIESTRGQVLWTRGDLAEVYYASTCGGATADIHQVWRHPTTPHLVSLRDADSRGLSWCRSSKYYRWRHSWSARELGQILRAFLPAAAGLPGGTRIGRVKDLRILSYTPEGRVKELEVITDRGRYQVFGDRIRSALKRDMKGNALRSIMFRLEKEHDAQGRLVRVSAVGAGWGHGIGMCQVGAIGRSKAGQGYQNILAAYYPGTQLRRLWR